MKSFVLTAGACALLACSSPADPSDGETGGGGSAGESTAGNAGGSAGRATGGAGTTGGAGAAGAPAPAGAGGAPVGGSGGETRDAGISPTDAATTIDAEAPPANLKPAIVAAGYGALRIFSFDGGKTWKNRVVNNPNGGDDSDLIRAIAYVEGLWVAAGWKIFLSSDGVTWKEINDKDVPGGWYDCVTAKDGAIIVKTIRADRGGQNGPAIVSTDKGQTWKMATGPTTCNRPGQPFDTGGGWLRTEWRGQIMYSANNSGYQRVLQECCGISNFAKGMAAEK